MHLQVSIVFAFYWLAVIFDSHIRCALLNFNLRDKYDKEVSNSIR